MNKKVIIFTCFGCAVIGLALQAAEIKQPIVQQKKSLADYWRQSTLIESKFSGKDLSAYLIAIFPKKKLLAAAGYYEHELTSLVVLNSPIAMIPLVKARVKALAFSADGAYLVTVEFRGSSTWLTTWDVEDGSIYNSMEIDVYFDAAAIAPDISKAAFGRRDGKITLYDIGAKSKTGVLRGHSSGTTALIFSPDSKLLVSGFEDGIIKVWDMKTKKQRYELKGHTKRVNVLAFSSEGSIFASGGVDGNVKLWDAKTGREIDSSDLPEQAILSLAFAPDASLLAVGPSSDNVRLYDIKNRRRIRTFQGTSLAHALVFYDDGKGLIIPDEENHAIRFFQMAQE